MRLRKAGRREKRKEETKTLARVQILFCLPLDRMSFLLKIYMKTPQKKQKKIETRDENLSPFPARWDRKTKNKNRLKQGKVYTPQPSSHREPLGKTRRQKKKNTTKNKRVTAAALSSLHRPQGRFVLNEVVPLADQAITGDASITPRRYRSWL